MLGTDLIPNFSLPNLTTLLVTRAYRTLPDGTAYSVAVGNIALGAQASNMSFALSGGGSVNGSLLTGYLADHNVVPSSSFGLHIGSASQRIPGSLWIGGYDQFRIIGPVSSQKYSQNGFPIDLLDISIGVAVGESPFNVSFVTGLLAKGNATLVPSLSVEVDSKEPYLYLPERTCQAIAAWLPVAYYPGLGLYLWNTQDPLYQRIVASPAYLGFTFRLNNAAVQNMTIKVPFKLLNLSLTEPLAHTPIPYFPCSLPTLPEYRLGRSFLQAAFMGVNWMADNHGVWFLAQAPGPNIGSQPQVLSIGAVDDTLQGSQQKWEDTWQGIWAPISEAGNSRRQRQYQRNLLLPRAQLCRALR
ncbi:Acid protease [Coniochaeta hoffmannii]|uniref:Acid protease n=1 Tax=Coniochaeta hoffmannii TaxID=91930 RepID=A0AA38VPR3_9PEZI|nr:Acid protease [Coniochaeta hoffmannii]